MQVASGSTQVAAGARVVAGQVGAIAGLRRGGVHGGSTAALRRFPHDQDGGTVALREGGDSREGAGGCGSEAGFVNRGAAASTNTRNDTKKRRFSQ